LRNPNKLIKPLVVSAVDVVAEYEPSGFVWQGRFAPFFQFGQRSSYEIPFIALSICKPHPTQDGLLQLEQERIEHILVVVQIQATGELVIRDRTLELNTKLPSVFCKR
jgi:hypothetical protein